MTLKERVEERKGRRSKAEIPQVEREHEKQMMQLNQVIEDINVYNILHAFF